MFAHGKSHKMGFLRRSARFRLKGGKTGRPEQLPALRRTHRALGVS